MATHKTIVEMELNTFKDSMWRLTNRVYILENFIKEKFGDVLLCVDVPVKENASVIKQGSIVRRKAKPRSSVNSKSKRVKHIPNSVDSDEEVGNADEDSTSGTDDNLLSCDVPVKESTSLSARVRISPKRKSRRNSSRNLANKIASDILYSESTKVGRNVAENAISELEIKEEYLYLADDSKEAEGEELQSGNAPDFIVNRNSPGSEVHAVLEYVKSIDRQQQIIKVKLDTITEKITSPLKESEKPEDATEPVIDVTLPIDTTREFWRINNSIKNDQTEKSKMIVKLGSIGGNNVNQTIYRIMAALMTDELMVQFTGKGRTGKENFSASIFPIIVFDSVRRNPKAGVITNKEVEDGIDYWLRKAANRLKRRGTPAKNQE